MKDRVIVITGGTGALGSAVTKRFLMAEAQVVVTYRADDELRSLLDEVDEWRSQLTAVRVDVTDPASLDELANRLQKSPGKVDSLICLVGGFAPGTLGKDCDEIFDRMMILNAKSFLLTCDALVPLMTNRTKADKDAWRQIIAVAARPALEPVKGLGSYAASKAAVVSLVKTLAVELLDQYITVNAIAPSTIDTAANQKAMPKADHKKWVKPSTIAETIFWLASNEAQATSGTVVPVYGKA